MLILKARQSFHFQKFIGALKNKFLLLQITIAKKKFFFIKMSLIFFLSCPQALALKKIKENIPPLLRRVILIFLKHFLFCAKLL